jgi:hypothetical protein
MNISGREIPQRKKDNRTDRNSGRMHTILVETLCEWEIFLLWNFPSRYIHFYGRVRILIKTRLKIKFDIFPIVNLSKFIFNRVLISIRTRPMRISLELNIFRTPEKNDVP